MPCDVKTETRSPDGVASSAILSQGQIGIEISRAYRRQYCHQVVLERLPSLNVSFQARHQAMRVTTFAPCSPLSMTESWLVPTAHYTSNWP